jgi:predicted MFS family arabinose efflux permease
VAFGVTNFAWASSYVLGVPLGGTLADVRGDALSYLSLTVVCLLTLLVLRKTA